MKALLVIVLVSMSAAAQETTQSPAPQPAASVAKAGDASTDPSTGTSAPTSGYNNSGGYGHRAEVFVAGFGQFANQTSGNAISEQVTNTGGFAVGYRFHLNSSSALEGRYGFSRDSEEYTSGGAVASIPAYLSEISGSYIYSFAKSNRFRPFIEGGGGVILFSPENYGTPTNSMSTGSGTTGSGTGTGGGGTPIAPVAPGFPYAIARPADVTITTSSGSTVTLTKQARGMFLFGAGGDFLAFSHFYIRIEFRGLLYKTPDFNLAGLETNTFSIASEPSVGFSYRF